MFLIEYIKRYKVTYISVIAIFLIGAIIGMFVTFKIPSKDKEEIENYVESSMDSLKNGALESKTIFKESLFSQIKLLSLVWILGCTVFASFTIYILMIYKGFLLRLHNNDNTFDAWFKKWYKIFDANCNPEKYCISTNCVFTCNKWNKDV